MYIGTKNFTREKFEYSDTAKKYKIDNTIPKELEQNAQDTLIFIQGIRDRWGSGIKINSGYRCEKLNKMVGGSKTSSHLLGYGVDLFPSNGDFTGFCNFVKEYIKDKLYDQVIIEKSGSSRWLHFGLKNNAGIQRKMVFNITK